MAIAYVGSPTAGTSTGTTVTTGSRTWTTGNVVVLGFATSNGALAVNSISASGGTIRAFAMPACIRNSSPGEETWVVFIDSGFTGTITANVSGSANHVLAAGEYSGVTGFGVGNSSAPTSTANPSLSLSAFSGGGAPWTVGVFVANSATDSTAGTGNLRSVGNLTNVTVAIVDNTSTTCAVTHASANWGIGVLELYDGGSELGNGVYTLTGTGSNGYASGYNGFQYGVSFTTGSNPDGYTLNSASVITNDAGNTGNLRAAVYDNDADPGKDLVADSGSAAFGIPAGSGTANVHVAALTATLLPSTTYHVTWNNDTSAIALRLDDTTFAAGTTARYIASAYGAPPDPWGSLSTEAAGPHMWVHVTAIAAAAVPPGNLLANNGRWLRGNDGRPLKVT